MIDYEVLCKAIENWKEGRRPEAVQSAPPPSPQQQQQNSEEHTMIYQMPEIIDE